MSLLGRLFSSNANRFGGRDAIIYKDQRLSYTDLDVRVRAMRAELSRYGFSRGEILPILATRCVDYVAVVLACSAMEIAYVPIDPVNPDDRISAMVDMLGCSHILSLGEARIPQLPAIAVLILDDNGSLLAVNATERRSVTQSAGGGLDLAIMFTSGTTGTPKGVRITHEGVNNLVASVGTWLPEGGGRFVHHSSIGFDAALFELWVPLLTGGSVVLNASPFDADTLTEVVSRSGCDTLLLTTSLFHLVVAHRPEMLHAVGTLFVGGETMKPAHAARALELHPALTLINGYGPTENTVFSTLHVVRPDDLASGAPLPIGRPLGHVIARVMGDDLTELPSGHAGELWLGGRNLSPGYLDPEKSREAFVQHNGSRFYRTGDIVLQDERGLLHYQGRADAQVKVKGYRVEIDEIERLLTTMAAVAQCAVLASSMNDIETRLICFIVVDQGHAAPDITTIQSFLSRSLPHYMIPSQVEIVPTLPFTVNGKLDRRSLLAGLTAGSPSILTSQSPDPLAARVMTTFGDILGRGRLSPDDSIYALGGSSLSVVVAQAMLDAAFEIRSDLKRLMLLHTVGQWIDFYRLAIRDAQKPTKSGMS
ncbi:coronamic acid synthetase (plasmid) [Azospirillum sp. B510]|uniref:non-ribosomal peptide synthetase n=1 Tax=Azospirillum sp. (strain B510) TaxID=137722 RepID=UPI0001C4B942|nr:non-ribosomal peptide synthetase [Azospirillum sp. B510]BAI73713.1 coronamic acid synthetase [Azospirillum sp. B510]